MPYRQLGEPHPFASTPSATGSHTHLMYEMAHGRPTPTYHHLELKLALHVPNLERRVEAFSAGQDQQPPRPSR